MQKVRLKGGSLSGTYLMTPDSGHQFVRKECSVVVNREYGFQRWYSQLKRMQRYSVMFPGLFPALLNFGLEGDLAYFDMPFIEGAITAHEYLVGCESKAQVDAFFSTLTVAMDRMHATKIPSARTSLQLYIREEVEQKLADALKNPRMQQFANFEHVVFNGEKSPGFFRQLDNYKVLFRDSFVFSEETFTHGNITLENMLYQPHLKRVVFIDPYEENIIDSVLAEYSQLYQSCHSYYELFNERTPTIEGNSVTIEMPRSAGLDWFDQRLDDLILDRFSPKEMMAVRLLEVSQFIRMLPFKAVLDEDKMLFFYALASNLFHRICEGKV
jgi:hypothetical protein